MNMSISVFRSGLMHLLCEAPLFHAYTLYNAEEINYFVSYLIEINYICFLLDYQATNALLTSIKPVSLKL